MNNLFASDQTILDWIELTLEEAEEPTFIMAITMENHGSHATRNSRGDIVAEPLPGEYMDEDILRIVNSYTATLEKADQMLGDLVAYLETRERPAVLLFFGDHLAWMDQERQVYIQGGYIATADDWAWNNEEALKMHATPFLIWSSEHNTPTDSGMLCPYFLGGMALEIAGLPLNDFYEALKEYRKILPVSRSFIAIDRHGELVSELSKTARDYLEAHKAYSRSLWQ
jgi:hypothetical protein